MTHRGLFGDGVVMTDDGRFVFVPTSDFSVFDRDTGTGALTLVEIEPQIGRNLWRRHVSPDERHLYVTGLDGPGDRGIGAFSGWVSPCLQI